MTGLRSTLAATVRASAKNQTSSDAALMAHVRDVSSLNLTWSDDVRHMPLELIYLHS